jgi:hypothetical protein
VTMKVTPCGSYKNRRFGGTYRLHNRGDKNRLARNIVVVIQMMDAIRSSETSVLIRLTRHNISEGGILNLNRNFPGWWIGRGGELPGLHAHLILNLLISTSGAH